MNFFFSESKADKLMEKINLRNLDRIATMWEHPCFPVFSIFGNYRKYNNDILKVPKKLREALAIGLVAMVLEENTGSNWWYYILSEKQEPPDGLIITLRQKNNRYKGLCREIEVVEYRDSKKLIINQIKKKVNTSYSPDTVVVCYVLKEGEYDFQSISEELLEDKKARLRDVFLVYSGIRKIQNKAIAENDYFKITLIQLTPKFMDRTIDIRESIKMYEHMFEKGQEARKIENNKIFYATRNKQFLK